MKLLLNFVFPAFLAPAVTVGLMPLLGVIVLALEVLVYRYIYNERFRGRLLLFVLFANVVSSSAGVGVASSTLNP